VQQRSGGLNGPMRWALAALVVALLVAVVLGMVFRPGRPSSQAPEGRPAVTALAAITL